MTRMAGEVADGFLCHGFTTERWIRERTVPALAEGRRRAGKPMEGFTVKAAIFLATGTEAEIEAEVADHPLASRLLRVDTGVQARCSTSTAGVTWART